MSRDRDAPYTVREAVPDDAEALIAHVLRLCDEPGVCITITREDFTLTPDEERRFIADMAAADNSVFLVAIASDGSLIGSLVAQGGKRRAHRHEATIGITVNAAWRGRGVGTALMNRCVEWARGSGVVKRLALTVFTRNAPAIRIYERLGFVTEGVCRKAVFREGRFEDNAVMALLL